MRFSTMTLLALVASSTAFTTTPRRGLTKPSFGLTMVTSETDSSSSPAKVVVERLPQSAVAVQIPVPGKATQAAYDKVCRELSKQVTLPGFRKGARIPPQVLEQAMAGKGGRNALKVQAINELVNNLVQPSLQAESLDPIGQPVLKVSAEEMAETFKPGEDLTLQVQCDVWPDIDWKTVEGQDKPYVGLKGKYNRKPFNQERLDQAVNDLKERYASLETITDADYTLQMGDACTVNMMGFMANADGSKGEALPNAASGDRVEVILGEGRYMTGLVEGLVGGKVGETKTVSVSFPDKLRDKTLAGKQAIFEVEILEASKRSTPEITDEFAAKVKAGLTADSLMEELRKAIDEEDKKEFAPARNQAIGMALSEVMDVEVPDTLVTNQAREKFAVMMAEMRDNGVDDAEIKRQINPENFAKYKDIVKDDIIRDFKVSMATDEIARLENVQVPDYQVEEQMEAIRKDAAESKEDFDEQLIRGKVEATLNRQAVFDWLAEKADLTVEYGEETFDEALMEKLAQESLEREEKIAEEKAATPPAVVEAEVVEPVETVVEEPEPVVEAVAEEAVVEEAAPEPVVEEAPSEPEAKEASTESEEARKERFANMSVEDRAYYALLESGAIDNRD